MLVHSVLPRSAANGPGERAVVWFQGCDLRCPGCWNESTHAFDRRRNRNIAEVTDLVVCAHRERPLEGVTFSGGEPMQQANAFLALMESLRYRLPHLTFGV